VADNKMINYGPLHQKAMLFPVESLQSDWVLVCEGETDCLVACQMGYPALTTTGGADTWRDEFTQQLAGKRVVFCYDADKAGRQGAMQHALKVIGQAASVAILKLPLAGTKAEKDITDYFVNLGHSKAEFDALLAKAETIEDRVTDAPAPDDTEHPLHLSQVGIDEYVGKRVRSKVLVAGKDLAPFQVPYKVAFKCTDVGSEKVCDRCGICKAGGQKEVTVPEWSSELLQMVNVPSEILEYRLAQMAKVPERCRKYTREVKEYANVEAVKVIPEIDFNSEHTEYVIRNMYYLGHGLETNHTYDVSAVVMPDPKNQYATALIYRADASQDSVEQFEYTDEVATILSMFKVGA
jgi:hypothetical protein